LLHWIFIWTLSTCSCTSWPLLEGFDVDDRWLVCWWVSLS
jgi:hypothetical protein